MDARDSLGFADVEGVADIGQNLPGGSPSPSSRCEL